MHDIFVSHSSKDRAFADKLVRALELRRQPCRIAPRDIKPGEDFQKSIVAALAASRAVLLLFSRNANLSSELPKEISLASGGRKLIIPVRLEHAVPEGALAHQVNHAQLIDVFHHYDTKLEELCGRLRDLLETPEGAPVTAKMRRRLFRSGAELVSRRVVLCLAAVTCLAIAAIFATERNATTAPGSSTAETPVSGGPIDVIDAANTSITGALPVETGVIYISRFQNDDTARFFSFRQATPMHDLSVTFEMATSDDSVRPFLAIHQPDGTRLFYHFPENQDGTRLDWRKPVTRAITFWG